MWFSRRKLTLLRTFTKRYCVKRTCAKHSKTVLICYVSACSEVIGHAHANSLCAAAAAAATVAATATEHGEKDCVQGASHLLMLASTAAVCLTS
jgi:hypothetical protein